MEADHNRVGRPLAYDDGTLFLQLLTCTGSTQAQDGLSRLDHLCNSHARGDNPTHGVDSVRGQLGLDVDHPTARVVGHKQHLLARSLQARHRIGGTGNVVGAEPDNPVEVKCPTHGGGIGR
ncbi:MAG: hypothetical protein MAG471_00722 [Acidimicrobiaceae bacterium]|nr:hypothetical protein [Acidimicrobiaceae bacterium]